jgi:hypothetical protein
MKVLCAILATGLCASAANADGLNFAWQNCYPEGGTVNRASTCTANLGSAGIAIASFQLTQPTDLVGFEATLLVQVESASLPPWWHFFNAGSCRQTGLTLSTAFGSYPNLNCHDPWSGGASGGIVSYQIAPGGVANAGRIGAFSAIPTSNAILASREYYVFALGISNAGTSACPGCATPATLVLQDLRIDSSVGGGFVYNHITTPLQNQCITWQGASNICATEARPNPSWGQIKSLYR